MFIFYSIDVDHQQQRTGRHSYGMPPLFALHLAVLKEYGIGIVENKRRAVEGEAAVLFLVDPVFLTVPFEPHRYTKCITRRLGRSTGQEHRPANFPPALSAAARRRSSAER